MANELEIRQNGIGGLVEDAPLTASATTLTSAALAAVGAVTATSFMWVILDPDGEDGPAAEHVKITLHSAGGTTATILRGQNNTTAREHPAGVRWIHGPVAEDFNLAALVHARDEKASGTVGGTGSTGSYQTRALNVLAVNHLGASLTSNEVSLPPGSYECFARVPGFRVGLHKARLYDVTGAAVLLVGSVAYNLAASASAMTDSVVQGRFTLAISSAVRLEHRITTTTSTSDLGAAAAFGDVEIYSELILRKVA